MIRANFSIKQDAKLQHSKNNEPLRTPFAIRVNDLSSGELAEMVDRFISMGAKDFGGKDIDRELKLQVISDIDDSVNGKNAFTFGSEKNVYLTLKFHADKSLRLVASSGKAAFDGGTIYSVDGLLELLDNLDCEMPLALDKSIRFQNNMSNDSSLSL